jgi:hypothetical protein
MKLALTLGFVTMLLMCCVLIWQRMRLHMAAGKLEAVEQEAVQLGLIGD